MVEALACGKPIVTRNVSSSKDMVVPAKTGIFFLIGIRKRRQRHYSELYALNLRARRAEHSRSGMSCAGLFPIWRHCGSDISQELAMFLRDLLGKLYYAKVFLHLKAHGRNVILSRGGMINRPEELELGSNVFISRNFHISARAMKIGNNVMIGPNFLAECDDHVCDRVGVTMFGSMRLESSLPLSLRMTCGLAETLRCSRA